MLTTNATKSRTTNVAGCTRGRVGLAGVAVAYLICGLSFLGSVDIQAQTVVEQRREYNVKAVFLYSFGRYVTWPESTFEQTDGQFVIGILGEDQFSGALDQIAAKRTVNERKIAVRRFENLEAYRPCQVLFVSRSLTAEEQELVVEELSKSGVLIVGETDGFAQKGGVVNFFVTGTKVQFEINAKAARLGGLTLDAKFMALGKSVN